MNFKYYKTTSLISLILVLSFVFNYVSQLIEGLIKSSETASILAGYVDVFSTISLITLTLTLVNFVGWKWKIFKWLVNVPNLNGRYLGELISSYRDASGNNVVKDCSIEIKQTASSIKIYSYYSDKGNTVQTSWAYSVSEELVQEDNGLFLLYYIFASEPNSLQTQIANQQTQIHNHEGTTTLKYYPDIKTLEGEYYNQRQNIGSIKVKFQQKKLIGRLIA